MCHDNPVENHWSNEFYLNVKNAKVSLKKKNVKSEETEVARTRDKILFRVEKKPFMKIKFSEGKSREWFFILTNLTFNETMPACELRF